jgi:hypothetical protein
MSDLDAEILALRVSGVSEREICLKLGCPLAREPVDASPGYRRAAPLGVTDGVGPVHELSPWAGPFSCARRAWRAALLV